MKKKHSLKADLSYIYTRHISFGDVFVFQLFFFFMFSKIWGLINLHIAKNPKFTSVELELQSCQASRQFRCEEHFFACDVVFVRVWVSHHLGTIYL